MDFGAGFVSYELLEVGLAARRCYWVVRVSATTAGVEFRRRAAKQQWGKESSRREEDHEGGEKEREMRGRMFDPLLNLFKMLGKDKNKSISIFMYFMTET